ncbi:MAG: hypothetical protein DRO01_05875 [Thermoproteota archaeon]|nr:MAG: hypothetical protein DRO01_05875 [Candidatus Korarchaeota archaeon]
MDDGYAYVYKDGLGISVAPGESVFLSFIQNFASNPSGLVYTTLWKNNNGDTVFVSLVRDDGKGQFTVVDDAGNWNTKIGNAVLTSKSHWITLELRRATSSTASDGYGKLYIDGVEDVIRDGQDNYDKFTSLNYIRLGVPTGSSKTGFVIDFDEVVVANRMVRPPLPKGINL